jgi:two-component system response regulator DevR
VASPTRVFLLDDHEVVRRGIAELLAHAPDFVVVGEAGTVEEGRRLIGELHPDLAVLDGRLPDGTGLELCRDIRSAQPRVRCLILTSYDDSGALLASVLAGASGYVIKQIAAANLLDSLRTVAAGGSLLDPALIDRVGRLVREGPPGGSALGALTSRESELAGLMADGLTNGEIASRTGLTEPAVRAYVAGIVAKLTA